MGMLRWINRNDEQTRAKIDMVIYFLLIVLISAATIIWLNRAAEKIATRRVEFVPRLKLIEHSLQ